MELSEFLPGHLGFRVGTQQPTDMITTVRTRTRKIRAVMPVQQSWSGKRFWQQMLQVLIFRNMIMTAMVMLMWLGLFIKAEVRRKVGIPPIFGLIDRAFRMQDLLQSLLMVLPLMIMSLCRSATVRQV